MTSHANGGCINCGSPRFSMQEIDSGMDLTKRNIYIGHQKGGYVILGVCEECYRITDYDLGHIKETLLTQELALLKEQNKPESLLSGIKGLKFEFVAKSLT